MTLALLTRNGMLYHEYTGGKTQKDFFTWLTKLRNGLIRPAPETTSFRCRPHVGKYFY